MSALVNILLFSAATISGMVRDIGDRPVGDVRVSIGRVHSTDTDAGGQFTADVPDGLYEVRFTHPGFRTETRRVKAGETVDVALTPTVSETIVVSAIRAESSTPVTTSEITREDIEARYHQQDIPLLLRDSPGINAWAESGTGGSGYSYITMRGVSPTRINFTLDGVPLADSEDMGTYFVDFPDLAHSLQSIQLQRGVGTSTVGSPSFGGSVNLQSIDLATEQQTHARVSAGSFGSRFATVGYQTGLLPGGYAAYGRLSFNESDGFRDSSQIEQRNLFVSAAKMGDTSQLRLTGFAAQMDQGLSFYAADDETLRTNLRANPLTSEEIDNFGYNLAQLQYLKTLPSGADMTASVYYQRGYGWYRLLDYYSEGTPLRQYGLDGMLVGSLLTFSRSSGDVTTNYGVHVNRFRRDHTRDLVGGGRDYANYGVKGEANAFAKVNFDRDSWHFYGDAQVRHSRFDYEGDVAIDPIDWTFFNPKIGVRYDLSSRASVYASTGLSTREPGRNDMFLGEDNPTISHDLSAVRPERVLDIETGVDYRSARTTLAANLYAMEFRNEIALTGELSEVGLPLRRNVPSSYRRGLELEATVQATPAVRLRSNANFSRNRISEWLEFRDVEPLLTPSIIISQALDYTPSPAFSAGVVGRYVSRSFLDNTNDEGLMTPSFVTLDGNVGYSFSERARVSLQVNNLLNNQRVFASGYAIEGIAYYYPQATRHFAVMVDFRL